MCCVGKWTQAHEPRHDKTIKMSVRPAKTQISLGIRPVWSVSSLSAWRKLGFLATRWVHSKDSDQTGWMPRLVWLCWGLTSQSTIFQSCRDGAIASWVINQYLDAQADLSLRWAHTHFVGFVMMQLICIKCLAFFRQPLRSYCCHPCYILVNFLKFRCANGSLSFLRCMLSGWFVFDVAKL